jgi:hypothetical protein
VCGTAECELKCGLLRALNSNKISFSIYRYLQADLLFEPIP